MKIPSLRVQMSVRGYVRLLLPIVALAAGCKENTINQTNINTVNNITQQVGPQGAVVKHPSGAELSVPPGAVDKTVEISIGEVASKDVASLLAALPGDKTLSGPVLAFKPHGQIFALATTLAMPYTDNKAGAPQLLRLPVGGGSWTQVQGTTINSGRVVGETKTFSFYAVAQPKSGGGGDGGDASGHEVCKITGGSSGGSIPPGGDAGIADGPKPTMCAYESKSCQGKNLLLTCPQGLGERTCECKVNGTTQGTVTLDCAKDTSVREAWTRAPGGDGIPGGCGFPAGSFQ